MGETVEVLTLPGMEGATLDPLSEAQLRSEAARRVFEARQDVGPWMDEYFDLMAEGWPWRKAVFILWASQPTKKRHPATQWELATEILGLTSDRVIREWKAKDPALTGKIKVLQASPLMRARADIFDALVESASKGNYKNHQDRKMALVMMGDYVEKQKLVFGAEGQGEAEEMSTEDLRAIAALPITPLNPPTGVGGGGEGEAPLGPPDDGGMDG
jgi:hypothetical protein